MRYMLTGVLTGIIIGWFVVGLNLNPWWIVPISIILTGILAKND